MGDYESILNTLGGLKVPLVTFEGGLIHLDSVMQACSKLDSEPSMPYHMREINNQGNKRFRLQR